MISNDQRGTKRERLETRVSGEQKELFQRAAALQGYTLSEFIVHTLHDAASQTVKESEVLALSARERDVFLNALLHPPAPSDALRRAAEDYWHTTQG